MKRIIMLTLLGSLAVVLPIGLQQGVAQAAGGPHLTTPPQASSTLANTGVKHETVADILAVADGAIVGTSLKVDGDTWNPVDPERVVDMMRRVREAREALVAG